MEVDSQTSMSVEEFYVLSACSTNPTVDFLTSHRTDFMGYDLDGFFRAISVIALVLFLNFLFLVPCARLSWISVSF